MDGVIQRPAPADADFASVDEQIESLRLRLSKRRDSVGLILRLAKVLDDVGHAAEAEALLREALSLAPNNQMAHARLQALHTRGTRQAGSAWGDDAGPAESAAFREPDAQPATAVADFSAYPRIDEATLANLPQGPKTQSVRAGPSEIDAVFASAIAAATDALRPEFPLEASPYGPVASNDEVANWRVPLDIGLLLAVIISIGLLAVLTRHSLRGIILQPLAEIQLPWVERSPPAALSLALPAPAPIPREAATRQAVSLNKVVIAVEVPPTIGAVEYPVQSTAVSVSVTIVYSAADQGEAASAGMVMSHLHAAGIPATFAEKRSAWPRRSMVGYYFDDDRPGALAAAGAGGVTGPVIRLVSQPGERFHRPGAVVVFVR